MSYTFKDFSEYWRFVKILTPEQIEIIRSEMSDAENSELVQSYIDGKWEDVFKRNKLNLILDEIKKELNHDMIAVRCRLMKGRSYYLSSEDWRKIVERIDIYDSKHSDYILGDIRAIRDSKYSRATLLTLDKTSKCN